MKQLLFKSIFLGNIYTSKGLNIVDRAELQSFVIAYSYVIIPFYIYSTAIYTTPYQTVSFSSHLFDPINHPLISVKILCIPYNW